MESSVIAGGFPCQDISLAGKGAGLAGERSGLWFEYLRIIKEAQPHYVIIENVSALRSRGLEEVLGSLAEIGYDAEWHCIPASAAGAPHKRDRVWIVANPNGRGCSKDRQQRELAKIYRERPDERMQTEKPSSHVPNAMREGLEGQRTLSGRISKELEDTRIARWWGVEPDVGRVANGIPLRVHRLKSLGNSIVPQIAQIIGEAILKAEGDLI
ncbi:MAG: DNA cytosine methyltransferase [Alphaproteobacteria bacterium]